MSVTVYFADDEAKMRENATGRLKIRNIQATCFETGIQLLKGLEIANTTQNMPTAVAVDYVMEGGGQELIQKIKKSYPNLPIIVVSGQDTKGTIQAYSWGAYAIMQKPLDYNEFADTLRELASLEGIYQQLATDALAITQFHTCFVWQRAKDKKEYRIVGMAGDFDQAFIRTRMDVSNYPRVSQMQDGQIIFWQDLKEEKLFKHKEEANDRNWVSLIAIPLIRNNSLIGWIDCYKHTKHAFREDDDDKQKDRHLGYLKHYGKQASEALHSTLLTRQMRIVHETNQNLAGTLDLALIYENVLNKVKESTGATCGWIYEYDPINKQIKLGGTFGLDQFKLEKVRTLKQGGITGKVVDTGESLYVPDVKKTSDGFQKSLFIPVRGLNIRSVLSVPFRRGETTLGVLTIKSTEIDFFTQDDFQLLTSLAAITAVSMERAKLTRHLSEITKLSQNGSSFNEISKYIVSAVQDLTDAEVNLWLLSDREEEGDDWLRIKWSSEVGKKANNDYIKEARVPTNPNESIIGKALHDKKLHIIQDVANYQGPPPFYNEWAIKKFDWHSFMTVPLIGKKGEHLGAISLFSKKINKFQIEDGELIQHLANQAAIALQDQKHFESLGELMEVGQELTFGLTQSKKLTSKIAVIAKKIAKSDFVNLYPYEVEREELEIEKEERFDKRFFGSAGNLKFVQTEKTGKPRKDGLASFIKKHGVVIVEQIKPGQIQAKVGRLVRLSQLEPGSDDYLQLERLISSSKLIFREEVRSFIGVALKPFENLQKEDSTNDEVVAILYINYRAPHKFSEQNLQALEIFCKQVSNILKNYRLFEDVKRQQDILEGIHNSSLHILSIQDPRKILENIVAEAVKLLKAKGGKAYLVVNGSKEDIKLVATKGLSSKRVMLDSIRPNTEGMAGQVVQLKKAQKTDNYSEYEFKIPDLSDVFTAVLEVPLIINEKVIGVLGVFDDREKRTFSKKDSNSLEKLASQAALAIYNFQLYEELDVLYQTSTQIVKHTDTRELAEHMLAELKRIVSYDQATFQLVKPDLTRELLTANGYVLPIKNQELLRPIQTDKLIQTVLASSKPLILNNVEENEEWDKEFEDTKNVKSWACIPLIYDQRPIGLITLDHYLPGYYQEKDNLKLERFGVFASTTLYNTLVSQQHLFELQSFSSRIAQLSSKDTKNDIILLALEIIYKVFEPTNCIFHFKDREFLPTTELDNYRLDLKELEVGEGLASLIAQEKETKLFPDDFDIAFQKHLILPDGVVKLFSPVWREGEVAGVLEIETRESVHEKNHKSFLSTLLAQASIAIQNVENRRRRTDAIKNRFNPYITGRPIRRLEDFYGRKKILSKILSQIHNNNFVVLGERRIGKTSLLYRLELELKYELGNEQIEFFTAYFSLEGIESIQFFSMFMSKVRQALNLIPVNFDKDYKFTEFEQGITTLSNELQNNNSIKRPIVVILIDEVDKLNKYPEIMQEQIRSILITSEFLRVVMVGVDIDFKEHSLTSPWYNFLNLERLEEFDLEEAKNLVISPTEGVCFYHPEALEQILKLSQCKPLKIQKLCSECLVNMYDRLGDDAPVNPIIIYQDVVSASHKLNQI